MGQLMRGQKLKFSRVTSNFLGQVKRSGKLVKVGQSYFSSPVKRAKALFNSS